MNGNISITISRKTQGLWPVNMFKVVCSGKNTILKYLSPPNTTKIFNIIEKGSRKIYRIKVSLKNRCVRFLMGCPVNCYYRVRYLA